MPFRCSFSNFRLAAVLSMVFCLVLVAVGAQSEPPTRQVSAVLVDGGPVQIDGVLDEAVWEKALPTGDFVQHEPLEGEPATEKTEVRIIYDKENLYIGVKCFDSEPAEILVTESERDSELQNTDAFWMVLDTFQDRQNGFVFGTNPSGLEFDAQVATEGEGGGGSRGRAGSRRAGSGSGGGLNKNWDATWKVAAQINGEGWFAEFKIPFSTLRFRQTSEQRWGVNFGRNIRRKNEEVFWSRVPRQWPLYRLTFAGELNGLEVEPPTNFKVTPYVIGSIQRDYEKAPAGDANYLGDTGVDVKYSVTPSMTLDLTYNTDFAQVEVDEQQVNLTRFNLFFPEKRPFFLENAGLFAVGSSREVELFFSRRIGIDGSGTIVPIFGGARLTGKLNRWNVGFLNMQTDSVGDCSEEGTGCVAQPANYTVGRVYREFGERSRLGGIVVNRQPTGSGIFEADYNRTFGLDGRLGVGESFLVTGYLAGTSTYHQNEPEAYDEGQYAYNVRAQHQTRSERVILEYTEVGEGFNPEVGFLRRKAYRNVSTSLMTYFRPSSIKWLREYRPHGGYTVYYDLNGFKESDELHLDCHVDWENGAHFSPAVNITYEGFLLPFEVFPGVVIPAGNYRNAEIAWRFNSDLSAPLSVDAGIDAGGFYSGNIRTYAMGLNWRYSSQLLTSLNYTHNNAEFPIEGPNLEYGGNFRTNLVAARVNYSFTPRIFLQSLFQYNDRGDNWSSNVRFGWLNNAGTGLYVVYNETRDLENINRGYDRRVFPGDPMNRALYIKFTREFQPF